MVTGGLAEVHTLCAFELAQRNVEASDSSHLAIEETEIDIHITPCRSTEHKTAIDIGVEILECLSTAAVGLVHVVALYALALG